MAVGVATGAIEREAALSRLRGGPVDVLVVGGGATGAGIALDAALRGLSVGLVERGDLASGTSQWSSKLVHGGLRYLAQGELGLMREALGERTVLRRIAPHLVRPLGFVWPVKSLRQRAWYGTGLQIYDRLSGLGGLPAHAYLDRDGCRRAIRSLSAERLRGGLLYYDCRTDDARLVLAVARSAVRAGAAVAPHAEVTALRTGRGGRVTGATVSPDGEAPFEVEAGRVVAATGVWTDRLRALAGDDAPTLRPSKGIHLVVDAPRLGLACGAILPAEDGTSRVVFLIPWGDRAIVGTTDDDYAGDLDHPHATRAEIAGLLGTVNRWTDARLDAGDVISTYAGLRPLVADPQADETSADLSRGHRVDVAADGLVTVIGGKLTTYRRMARDAVDAVAGDFAHAGRRPRTDRLALVGGEPLDPGVRGALRERAEGLGLELASARQLLMGHGSEAGAVLDLVAADADLARPLSAGLPWTVADAAAARRIEGARTVEDVLLRRTKVALQARDRGQSAVAAAAVQLGLDPAAESAAWAARVAAERAAEGA